MILCKIKSNEQIKIVTINQHSIYKDEQGDLIMPNQKTLKLAGYHNGHFELTYYLMSPWKGSQIRVFAQKLQPTRFSKDRTQMVAKFVDLPQGLQLTSHQEIKQFQEIYDKQKQNVKFIAYIDYKKLSVVQHLKFNYFTEQFVMRFSQPTSFKRQQDEFFLFSTKHQPIVQQYDLIPTIEKQQQEFITILPPKIQDDIFSSGWINRQTLSSLRNLQDISDSLAINNAIQTIYYDVNNPQTFVHFGTYMSRVDSFLRKYFDLFAPTIPTLYNKRRRLDELNQIVKGMNTFERFHLLNSGLVEFTQNEEGNYEFEKFLIPQTDSQEDQARVAIAEWYNQISGKALQYDKNNIHALHRLIPQDIMISDDNADLITFINIIGDTLDQFWSAIRGITNINSLLQTELQHFSFNYLVELLKNYGIEYQRGYRLQDLNKIFFESSVITQDGGNPKYQLNKYNKLLLVRLLANIPFLLKTKGSRYCIQQLYNIFGLSQGLLKIREFAKQSYTGQNSVTITKPYLNGNLKINVNEAFDQLTVLVHFRFLTDERNGFSVSLKDNEIINENSVSNIPKNKSLLLIFTFQSSNGKVHYHIYSQGMTHINAELDYNETWPYIKANKGIIHIDNVKVFKEIISVNDIVSKYLKGTNIIHSRDNLLAIHDFNSLNRSLVSHDNIDFEYDDSDIVISTFEQIMYSSIFSLANTPAKYYYIEQNDMDELPIQTNEGEQLKVNFPNVHIGSLYSDYYDSQFIIDYQNQFQDLLDINQYDQYKNQYRYKRLQDYKALYSQYFNMSNSNYGEMVKFYENLDTTFFKILDQFMPYGVNPKYGVILNNNILQRNKIPTIQPLTVQVTPSPVADIPHPDYFKWSYTPTSQGYIYPKVNFEGTYKKSVEGNIQLQLDRIILQQQQKATAKVDANITSFSGLYTDFSSINTMLDGRVQTLTSLYASGKPRRIRWYAGYCKENEICQYPITPKYKSVICDEGQIITMSALRQRKMIVDQDRKLKVTKINFEEQEK